MSNERNSQRFEISFKCREASPVNYNEEATLLESLAGASKVAKACADMKSQKDKRGCLCLEAVLGDINQYLKLRRGKYERVLERVIETVINCKHNPFYGGSFNGNDCFRLLHNNDLLFDALISDLLGYLTKLSARSSWRQSMSSGRHTSVYQRDRLPPRSISLCITQN